MFHTDEFHSKISYTQNIEGKLRSKKKLQFYYLQQIRGKKKKLDNAYKDEDRWLQRTKK